MWPFRKRVPIRQQLAALAAAGITVNDCVTDDDLAAFVSIDEMERAPYRELVTSLATEIEREPFTPKCDRLWLCDFECIEDTGAYREVIERLELMTARALRLERIEDAVEIEEDVAWVGFEHAGRRVQWDMRVDNDWLDPSVFRRYDALLRDAGGGFRLFADTADHGQSALLGAFRPAEKRAFDAIARVRMVPVAERRM